MGTLTQKFIVTRKISRLDSEGKPVLVRVGKPRKVSVSEWECAFHISNIGMDEINYGLGIDGLQALIQAIEGVRVFLEKSGYEFSWDGGEEGDTGIPRYVPTFYGKNFTEHLYKLIDSEIELFAQSAERKYASEKESVDDADDH